MSDLEKVIKGLECCKAFDPSDGECPKECPYRTESNPYQCCMFTPLLDDAIAMILKQHALATHDRDEFMRSWKTIKSSVIETAKNNAGPDGNEDVYRILTWVATMMGLQEAKWNA